MTAQILTSELSNLIQESKRKNSELRNVCVPIIKCPAVLISTHHQAAEKSLDDLKGLRVTSEAQIAAGRSSHLSISNTARADTC